MVLSYYCHTNAVNCTRIPRSGHVGCRSGQLVERMVYNRYKVSKSIECWMGRGKEMRLGQRERVTGKAGLYSASSGPVEDGGGVSNRDRDRLEDSIRSFVDKNFIPLALLCAASIGYVFAHVKFVHGDGFERHL